MTAQVGWQVGAYDSLDAKAGMLLAFDGLVTGLLLHLRLQPVWARVCVLIAILASAAMSVAALWPREPYTGPLASSMLYGEFHGVSEDRVTEVVVSRLSVAARANARMIEAKSTWWKWASTALLCGVLLAAAVSMTYS